MNDPFINCNTDMWDLCGIGPMEGHLNIKKLHMTTTVTKHIGVDGSSRGHMFYVVGPEDFKCSLQYMSLSLDDRCLQ